MARRDKLPALKKLIDIALAGDREAIPGTRANTDVNRDALIGAQLEKLYGRSVVENLEPVKSRKDNQ